MSPYLPLERMTRRWWLLLLLLALLALPAYAAQPLTTADQPYLLVEVVTHGFLYWFARLFPLFKLLPAVLIAGLWWNPTRFTRLFHLYASLNLLLAAFLSNAGETPTYGFAVLTGAVLSGGLLAAIWGWEAAAGYAWLGLRGKPIWRYWVVLPALLTFLYPVRSLVGATEPVFSLAWALTNEAGLVFCTVMPLYLAVLCVAHPYANSVVLRVSGFVSMMMALIHITQYLMRPFSGLWLAVIHLPLLVLGIYAFALSYEKVGSVIEQGGLRRIPLFRDNIFQKGR